MKDSESVQQILVNLPVEGVLKKSAPSQPFLTDTSSVDSALYESDSSLLSVTSHSKRHLKRRVSFHKIEVREYSLTVGDHPLCRDGLPLQLDWAHGPSTEINMICSRERETKYQMPRRLSYEEKRNRLINTTDYRDQRDRNQALGQVIQRMQSWWEQHPVLPMPKLHDIQEEESTTTTSSSSSTSLLNPRYQSNDKGETDFEIEPPKLEEFVMEWRRNKPSSPRRRSRRC